MRIKRERPEDPDKLVGARVILSTGEQGVVLSMATGKVPGVFVKIDGIQDPRYVYASKVKKL